MPLAKILSELKSDEKYRSFELKLILQIAALLKNKKESGMVMLNDWELRIVESMFPKAGIACFVLYSGQSGHLTLLYRSERLRQYLMSERILTYLKAYGYEPYSLEWMLWQLAGRYRQYTVDKQFPHEIGLFLGYPLCDVEGFIDGKSCLYSGYWKIYDNLEQTLGRFKDFDEAKNEAICEWFSGKSIIEIAA